MNRPSQPAPAANDERRTATPQTPGTDMQPEDTGTAQSGNSSHATGAEKAMKQTSKTPAEQDGKA